MGNNQIYTVTNRKPQTLNHRQHVGTQPFLNSPELLILWTIHDDISNSSTVKLCCQTNDAIENNSLRCTAAVQVSLLALSVEEIQRNGY